MGSRFENSKLKELIDSAIDSINEQVWFQELKGKWEELDPQSRTNLKFASAGLGLLLVLMLILTSMWSVHSLKSELSEKRSLLLSIQSANDEVRRLRDSVPSATGDESEGGGTWTSYFEGLTMNSGLDRSSLSVSTEKSGTTTEQSKETLYELSLKHVNIKQVVRYAFSIENGQRPVKLRNLSIDTKGDPTGYLDATLAVSAFSLIKQD